MSKSNNIVYFKGRPYDFSSPADSNIVYLRGVGGNWSPKEYLKWNKKGQVVMSYNHGKVGEIFEAFTPKDINTFVDYYNEGSYKELTKFEAENL